MSDHRATIRLRKRLARAERAAVGMVMRLVAIVAERRVRRGLEEREPTRSRHGVHFDIREARKKKG